MSTRVSGSIVFVPIALDVSNSSKGNPDAECNLNTNPILRWTKSSIDFFSSNDFSNQNNAREFSENPTQTFGLQSRNESSMNQSSTSFHLINSLPLTPRSSISSTKSTGHAYPCSRSAIRELDGRQFGHQRKNSGSQKLSSLSTSLPQSLAIKRDSSALSISTLSHESSGTVESRLERQVQLFCFRTITIDMANRSLSSLSGLCLHVYAFQDRGTGQIETDLRGLIVMSGATSLYLPIVSL